MTKAVVSGHKYTHRSAAVNARIEADLQQVVQVVRQQTPDLVSVVLMGGFAKGEGSVKVSNKKITPLNDYDIYFITQLPKTEAEINKINLLCNQAIKKKGQPFHGFEIFYDFETSFFIDLHHLTTDALSQLYPMIRTYDLRNHSLVLWGKDIRLEIPDFTIKQVSTTPEALRLLFNRMTNLVQFFRPEFLNLGKNQQLPDSLIYYTSRTIISAAWVMLIYKQKTKFTNREILLASKKHFATDYPRFMEKFPHFLNDLEAVTAWKLKPFQTKVDPVTIWFRSRKYLGYLAKMIVEETLHTKAVNWTHLSYLITKKLPGVYYRPYLQHKLKLMTGMNHDFLSIILSRAYFYLNWLFFLRVKQHAGQYWSSLLTLTAAPDLYIFSTLPLIIFSITKDQSIKRSNLLMANRQLQKIFPFPKNLPSSDTKLWHHLADNYGQVYILFFWQKLV
jgi:hypothetical protein